MQKGNEEGRRSDVMPAFWGLIDNAVITPYAGNSILNVYADHSERDPAPLRDDNMNTFVKSLRLVYFLNFLWQMYYLGKSAIS